MGRLSDLDKAFMVIAYPRNKPHSEAPQWTIEKALDVMGVPSEVRIQILQLSSNSSAGRNAKEIRDMFFDWQKLRIQELLNTNSPVSSK
jgi:hypothetical protein